MTAQSDRQVKYSEYAEHCLHTVRMMPNREARDLQRRMAAEWLKFADALLAESTRHTSKHRQFDRLNIRQRG
jgi:hypothetical protein